MILLTILVAASAVALEAAQAPAAAVTVLEVTDGGSTSTSGNTVSSSGSCVGLAKPARTRYSWQTGDTE